MTKYKTLIMPSAFIILAFVFFWATSINFCTSCTGFNVLNPFCWAASAACAAWTALFNTILIIAAFIFLITGVFQLRKVKI